MTLILKKGLRLRNTWRIAARSVPDLDAAAYIAAVEAADGQALETGVKDAITEFVLGCKADGIWNAIKASCIMAGARTLAGALVPLKGAAPTNFNFVAGDYNRKTGLVGNGTTKYLDSNRNNNADPQNSKHLAVYASQRHFNTALYIATPSVNTNGDSYLLSNDNGTLNTAKLSSSGIPARLSGSNLSTGLFGASRNNSSSITVRRAQATVTESAASVAPINENFMVFGVTNFRSNARLAFYSIGESLDLDLLDARVTTLMNTFATIIP